MRDVIASSDNKFYKLLKKLDKKKYRDENSIFKAEGEKFLNENINFNKIIVKESKFEYFDERYGISEHDNLTILKDNLFDEVSTQENSQGIMFLYSKNLNTIEDVKGDVVILDDVQDPGNVGTMIRTADAANFDGVLLTDQSADLYNMKTLRSMQGSHFHLPVIRLPKEQLLTAIEESQLPIYATTLSQDSIDYKQVEKVPAFVLVMGNEGQGISDQMAEKADQLVHITMPGQAESLNVAVAAGILIFSMIEE